MLKINMNLYLVLALCGLPLLAQDQTNSKNVGQNGSSSTGFARRSTASESINSLVSDESVYDEEELDYAMPSRADLSPLAPTICRHYDLRRDMEFRLCMNQMLDTSESFRENRSETN